MWLHVQYADTLEKRQVLAKKSSNDSLRLGRRVGNSSQVMKIGTMNQRQSRLGMPKEMGSTMSGVGTEHLQEQLEAYDERLSLLRSQLRESVDQKLRSSIYRNNEEGKKKSEDVAVKETIVQGLVTATGQGCKEVLQGSVAAKKGSKSGHVWKSRSPKGSQMNSSCTLKLDSRNSCNVTIKITFADGDSVPGVLLFEHAPKATAAFKPLGKVYLQQKSLRQLKHVFHLGKDVMVDRYLRVSCKGQIGDTKNNFHAVTYLFISGEAAECKDVDISDEEEPNLTKNSDVVEVHVSMDNISPSKHAQVVTHTKPKKKTTPTVWERLSGHGHVVGSPGENATRGVVPKSSPQHVLDKDRVKFVEDVLRALKMSASDAAEMVKNIVFGNDSSVLNNLSQRQVDDLITCLPTKDERRQLRFLNRASIGNDAEDFMYEVVGIDNLEAKVETKLFLADFDARAAVVQDAANLISRACHEIHECSKLHLAIKIILKECSKSLNGAKILDVNLLTELKNAPYSSTGSLLHFVAAKMSEAAGSVKVPNIAKDLPSCSSASQVMLSEIKCELKQLSDGIEEAGTAWRADEPAAATIEKKINMALTKLASTEAIVTETEADFIESAIDAGLDPSSVQESKDLFLAILSFSDELNNAHLENKCTGFLTKSKQDSLDFDSHSAEKEMGHEEISDTSDEVDDVRNDADGSPQEEMAAQPPISSRVSIDQLLESAEKQSIKDMKLEELRGEPLKDSLDGNSEADYLSTPVRRLLQSSRAIINSFDLNTLEVTPYKYNKNADESIPCVEDVNDDGLCEISSPPTEMMHADCTGFGSEAEAVSHSSNGGDNVEDVQISAPESHQVDESVANPKIVHSVEEKSTDKSAANTSEVAVESSVSGKTVEDSIDLNLAAKLLKNAEQVKMSRSQLGSQKPPRRKSSLGRSRDKQSSVSKSRASRLNLSEHQMSQTLTPEQTKAVKALGEVIRQSMPKFSSVEADTHSGLHIDSQNLDLDKILSALIRNAGNTPTGPLARGVRGGNMSIFDGEEARELRRLEKERYHGTQAGRKALLEPVIPAPLGMGVTVSKTVSEGISPETIARSLHSGMRTSSMRTSSSKSGKGSVHQRLPQQQQPLKAIGHGSLHDSAPWKMSQENNVQLKSSHRQSNAPEVWKDNVKAEEENAGMYEQKYPTPTPEERVIDTPPHGLDLEGKSSDLDGLSPMGLRCTRDDALRSSRENAAMAADRMQLWGYNM